MRCKWQQKLQLIKRLEFLPEINSLGICFLPDVVTWYNVKSSMRSTTHELISLFRLAMVLRNMCESSDDLDDVAECCGEVAALGPG